MEQNYTVIDRAALALSGALISLGVVVLGAVEVLAGPPYGAAPVEQTNDAGEVVNTIYPAVDPTIRTGLVLAGLAVLLLWGLYRMTTPASDPEVTAADVTAD